jgi:hypothetical protein
MFCIVTVVRVHVLYCDSGTRENSFKSTALYSLLVWLRAFTACPFFTRVDQKWLTSPVDMYVRGF